MSLFRDIIFMVGLTILVITGIVAIAALVFNTEAILTGDAVFGISWLEVIFILFIIAYGTVIARLIKLYGNWP